MQPLKRIGSLNALIQNKHRIYFQRKKARCKAVCIAYYHLNKKQHVYTSLQKNKHENVNGVDFVKEIG